MSHTPTKATQLLVMLKAGQSTDRLEPSDYRYAHISPSFCVPALPKTYEKLEQLFDEGFVITAMAPHPDNRTLAPGSKGLVLAMRRL